MMQSQTTKTKEQQAYVQTDTYAHIHTHTHLLVKPKSHVKRCLAQSTADTNFCFALNKFMNTADGVVLAGKVEHRLSMSVVEIHIKALIEPDDQAVRVVSFQTFVNPRRGLYILA